MSTEHIVALLNVFMQNDAKLIYFWDLRKMGMVQGETEHTCTPKGSALCQAIHALAKGYEVS